MWPEQVGQSLRSAAPSDPFPGSPFPGSPVAHAAGAPGSPDVSVCLTRAIDRLSVLQHTDGAFEGEVVWCPMILAQYVILRRILQRPIGAAERARMILHFKVTRRPDGGWGLHPESGSYVFVTTISYVALRLLGEPADADLPSQAWRWLMAQPGGVLAIPTWGKFWLALIGLYDFRGMNPFLPELFLLPDWFPVHPNQLYCHTRYIYLAISCLYGARVHADLGPITQQLRQELYSQPYEAIDFAAHRHDIAAADLYVAPSSGPAGRLEHDGSLRALAGKAAAAARVAQAGPRALPGEDPVRAAIEQFRRRVAGQRHPQYDRAVGP